MREKIQKLREAENEARDEHIQIAIEHAARIMERILEQYEDEEHN